MIVSLDLGDLDVALDEDERRSIATMVRGEMLRAVQTETTRLVRAAAAQALQPLQARVTAALRPVIDVVVQRILDGDQAFTAEKIARAVLEGAVE